MRDDLLKIARAAVAGSHRTIDDGAETMLPAVRDPATYEPPEWVLEAMQLAYEKGLAEGATSEREMPF